jgi:hypothetical protein
MKRQQLWDTINGSRARIKAFEETNAVLIEQAAQEKRDIERDTPFKVAYDFLYSLRHVRSSKNIDSRFCQVT